MTILEELLGSLSLEEFFSTYLFKMPYAAPDTGRRFRGLLSWSVLDEIFKAEHADCWLPKQGRLREADKGRLTLAEAQQGFSQGRTVLVRHAEKAHPRLKEIAQDFHDLFHEPVDMQLYWTPAEEEGFDWHYDVEEVFVIQSVGAKEFRLRKNTVCPWPVDPKFPQHLHFAREIPTPEIRCLLHPGDWLYIPAGYWHKARAVTDSFHMSVGVWATSAVDYLRSLLPILAQDPVWRQRLPVKGHTSRAALREFFNDLSAHLIHDFNNIERFQKFERADQPLYKQS